MESNLNNNNYSYIRKKRNYHHFTIDDPHIPRTIKMRKGIELKSLFKDKRFSEYNPKLIHHHVKFHGYLLNKKFTEEEYNILNKIYKDIGQKVLELNLKNSEGDF